MKKRVEKKQFKMCVAVVANPNNPEKIGQINRQQLLLVLLLVPTLVSP